MKEVKFKPLKSLVSEIPEGTRMSSDIEGNGLLHEVTKLWCIVSKARDGRVYTFHDYPELTGKQVIEEVSKEKIGNKVKKVVTHKTVIIPERDGTLDDGAKFLHLLGNKSCKLVFHNAMNYDKPVIERFWPKFNVPFTAWHDTYLQSTVQWFDRPALKGVKGNHGLAYYGAKFGRPKPPIEDWSYIDAAKLHRCIEDVYIQEETDIFLEQESKDFKERINFNSEKPLEIEHKYAWYSTEQELHGAMLDIPHMKECVKELDSLVEDIRKEVEPQLPRYIEYPAKVSARDCALALGSKKLPRENYVWVEYKGEIVKRSVKKWYKPTTKIFNKKERVCYHITYKDYVTGEEKLIEKVKLKEARACMTALIDTGNYVKKDFSKYLKKITVGKVVCDNVCKALDITPDSDLVWGAYTRIKPVRAVLTQHERVKDFLLSLGWQPTEYNFKKDKDGKLVRNDRGQLIETSPKLTEDSFSSLPEGIGQRIAEYNTYVHRRRYLENSKDDEKGLLNMVREDGRISAGMKTFGTSTGRGAQTSIVNLPSPKALFGEPMRKCVVAPKGRKLIGCDQSGAQLRIAADKANNEEYAEALVRGQEFEELEDGSKVYHGTDAHTINCIGFGLATEEQRKEAFNTQKKELVKAMSNARGDGKNGTYAVIFGCSGKKLAVMIGVPESVGEERKLSFLKKLKLDVLIKEKEKECKKNKRKKGGYIETASGYFVYCSSPHKVLNYFIQGFEAILQRHGVIYAVEKVREEGLDAHLILNVHDEMLFESSEDDSKRVARILEEAYVYAAKEVGLWIEFGGDSAIGVNYYEVH